MKYNKILIALALCAAMQSVVSFSSEKPQETSAEPQVQSYWQQYAPQRLQDMATSVNSWSTKKKLQALVLIIGALAAVYNREQIMQWVNGLLADKVDIKGSNPPPPVNLNEEPVNLNEEPVNLVRNEEQNKLQLLEEFKKVALNYKKANYDLERIEQLIPVPEAEFSALKKAEDAAGEEWLKYRKELDDLYNILITAGVPSDELWKYYK